MTARKRYTVASHGFDWDNRKILGAIDSDYDLDGALARACELIRRGEPNVVIQDGEGNSISGDALVACCNSVSILSPDLRAMPK